MSKEKPPKRCATCGSDVIATTENKCDEGEIRAYRRCMICKTTWTDVYIFVRTSGYCPGA